MGISTSSFAVTVPPWLPQTSATSLPLTFVEESRPMASYNVVGLMQGANAMPFATSWDPPPNRHAALDYHGHRSSWDPPHIRAPPSSHAHDPSKLFRMDPPTFDGSNAQSWVTCINYYFDHIMLPPDQRLHIVIMLFAPPTSDWVFSYRANNPYVSWN